MDSRSISRSSLGAGKKKADHEEFLEKGAAYALWILGALAALKFFEVYAGTFKPVVLAGFFVACLEPFVARFELLLLFGHDVASRGCSELRRRCTRGNHLELLQAEDDDEPSPFRMRLGEQAGKSTAARLLAVLVVLSTCVSLVWFFLVMLFHSVSSMEQNIPVYKRGVEELGESVRLQVESVLQSLPAHVRGQIVQGRLFDKDGNISDAKIVEYSGHLQHIALELMKTFLESFQDQAIQLFFFVLYSILWLLEPLHITGMTFKHTQGTAELQQQLYTIARQYLKLKALCNLIFALCVVVLLYTLNIDLVWLIALLCWVINFIPELGAIISCLLPLPLVILDSRMPFDERVGVMLFAFAGMVVIKAVVGNFVETAIMSRDPVLTELQTSGRKVDGGIHPVAILLAVVLAGEVWGPIGMLIAVPFMSIARFMLIDERVQESDSRGDSRVTDAV